MIDNIIKEMKAYHKDVDWPRVEKLIRSSYHYGYDMGETQGYIIGKQR